MKKDFYYKLLKIKHDIKKWQHRLERKKVRKENKLKRINSKNSFYDYGKMNYELYPIKAPENFSFIENISETVKFFSDIDELVNSKKRYKIFIDLQRVKKISVDAVMYLIAKIKKLQHKRMTNKAFYGNVPLDETANKILSESGFYDFVNSQTKTKITKDKISISSGDKFEGEISKKMCDFIIENSEYERDDVYYLYEMLSEMMSNTDEHAYNEIYGELNNWYLYSEQRDDKFIFIFLDTGVGIPTSINKRLMEKIMPNDTKLLISAFNGEFRSSTKLKTRGRGLQYIKNCYEEKKISNLFVVSNKGIINFNESDEKRDLKLENVSLTGTLYYWEIN